MMCELVIMGKTPKDRDEFKVKIVDKNNKMIDKDVLDIINEKNIEPKMIKKLVVMETDKLVDYKEIDFIQPVQEIEGNLLYKLMSFTNVAYFFDNDIIAEESVFKVSVLNKLIRSNKRYFVLYIKYDETRKLHPSEKQVCVVDKMV